VVSALKQELRVPIYPGLMAKSLKYSVLIKHDHSAQGEGVEQT